MIVTVKWRILVHMTNEELLQDLKQFIATTVSQQVTGVEQRLGERIDNVEERLSKRIDGLEQKLDHVQDAVAEAISGTNEAVDTTLSDHEQRLRRLEHRAA